MSQHFLTRNQLAQRWGVGPRTIARRTMNPPEGFPLPIVLAGRTMFDLAEVERYERLCAAASRQMEAA